MKKNFRSNKTTMARTTSKTSRSTRNLSKYERLMKKSKPVPNRKPRIYGYSRVSSDSQVDGHSYATQVQYLYQMVTMIKTPKAVKIDSVVNERASGFSLNKRKTEPVSGEDMIERDRQLRFQNDVLANLMPGDLVLVAQGDRLCRRLEKLKVYLDIIHSKGARLGVGVGVLGHDLRILFSDVPEDRAQILQIVAVAEQESQQMSVRQLASRAAKQQATQQIQSQRPEAEIPYGWKNAKQTIRDPAELMVIRQIMVMAQKLSTQAILTRLQASKTKYRDSEWTLHRLHKVIYENTTEDDLIQQMQSMSVAPVAPVVPVVSAAPIIPEVSMTAAARRSPRSSAAASSAAASSTASTSNPNPRIYDDYMDTDMDEGSESAIPLLRRRRR